MVAAGNSAWVAARSLRKPWLVETPGNGTSPSVFADLNCPWCILWSSLTCGFSLWGYSRRVQAVNQAFARLRKHVPLPGRGKRVSKVKTLRLAIDYIAHLQDILARPARSALTYQEPGQRPMQAVPHSNLMNNLSNSVACKPVFSPERGPMNPYFRPPFPSASDCSMTRNLRRELEVDLSVCQQESC